MKANEYALLVANNFLRNISLDGSHEDTGLRIFNRPGLPEDLPPKKHKRKHHKQVSFLTEHRDSISVENADSLFAHESSENDELRDRLLDSSSSSLPFHRRAIFELEDFENASEAGPNSRRISLADETDRLLLEAKLRSPIEREKRAKKFSRQQSFGRDRQSTGDGKNLLQKLGQLLVPSSNVSPTSSNEQLRMAPKLPEASQDDPGTFL